jgi:hypothetical protein
MRRTALAMGFGLAVALSSPSSWAQDPPAPLPAPTSPASAVTVPAPLPPLPPSGPATAAAPSGLAVVAVGGATDAAWPLARVVYANPALRPTGLDEAAARVLCGEAPAPGASRDLRDLADSLAAVRGDDAPSRMLLVAIARRLNVRALVVVRVDGGQPTARVFLPESGAFDAAAYGPDGGPAIAWSATASSLARTFGNGAGPGAPAAPPAPASAPPLATHEEPVLAAPPPHRKAFYESGWFWGAVGAAAFAGGAIFFATRDNGESTIHLQATVPH